MAHGPRKNITQNAANNALVLTQNGNTIALTIDSDATSNPLLRLIQVNANTRGDIAFSAVRTSDPSSPPKGDWWYNATDNKLRYHDGTVTNTILVTGDLTLQGAYDGGSSITATAAQTNVLITVPDTASTHAGLHVDSSSTTVSLQEALRIGHNATAGSGGWALRIDSPSATGNDHHLIDLRRPGTGETVAAVRLLWGHGTTAPGTPAAAVWHFNAANGSFTIPMININCSTQTGSTTVGIIDVDCGDVGNTQLGARAAHTGTGNTGIPLQIAQQSTTSSAKAIHIQDSSQNDVIQIDKATTGTGGVVLDLGKSTGGTGNIIDIQNDGTGDAFQVSQNGNGIVVLVTKTNTGGSPNMIDLNNSGSGHDIQSNLWRIDNRGHALLSSIFSKLKNAVNGSTVANAFSGATRWEQIGMNSAQGDTSLNDAYRGASFDGRFLYFVPHDSDTFIRYETAVPFDTITSWTQFAVSSGQGGAAGNNAYAGTVYDGRYIYYTPFDSDTFTRYDTTQSFTSVTSWQQIGMSSGQGATALDSAYSGMTYDGRYVYFCAHESDTFVRYDTTKSFTDVASWDQMAMSSAQGAVADTLAYNGAVFDSRYVYFVPFNSDTFIRYDTTASFTAIASWEQLRMSSAKGGAAVDSAYIGAVFDGRFIFYCPHDSDTFLRYNTTRSFTDNTNAWTVMQMNSAQGAATLNNAYAGVTFDGRYVYYVSYTSATCVRYDPSLAPTLGFQSVAAWRQVAVSSTQGGTAVAAGYDRAAFDGRYVYFCAHDSDTFIRFLANNASATNSTEYAQVSS